MAKVHAPALSSHATVLKVVKQLVLIPQPAAAVLTKALKGRTSLIDLCHVCLLVATCAMTAGNSAKDANVQQMCQRAQEKPRTHSRCAVRTLDTKPSVLPQAQTILLRAQQGTCAEFASSNSWVTAASKFDWHEKGSIADNGGFVSAKMTARKRSFFTILFTQYTHDTNGIRARKRKAKRCIWARKLSFGLLCCASWF